jgi:hypothetical protein
VKQYDTVNRCLEALKSSDIDMVEKLRIDNLLLQIKMLLLVDIYKQDAMPEIFEQHNFEKLLAHVEEVCRPGIDGDSVKDLLDHVREMHSAMSEFLNRTGEK